MNGRAEKIKKYKMIVLDLDGTLLNNESRLEMENAKALRSVMKNGKKIALCSSRSFDEMSDIMAELYRGNRDQYCIGYGGACVFDTKGNVIVTAPAIEREDARILIENAKEKGIHIHGYDRNRLCYWKYTKAFEGFLKFARLEDIPIVHLAYEEFLEKDYLKLMCLGEMSLLETYRKEMSRIAGMSFSNPSGQQGYLDICEKSISKRTGVSLLCEYLGIEREECICVGDGENDISMLQYAGLGIAVKNAGGKVKNAADYVLPYTNEENAICYLVKKIVEEEE